MPNIIANHSLEAVKLSCIRQHQLLFSDLSFCVTSGTALLVKGPNGAGKSSLLRLLAGIATPSAGSIQWQGKLIGPSYPSQLHYIGHSNGIKLGLSVWENLQWMNALCEQQAVKMEETLSLLKLDVLRHRLAAHLSAGQKRRIALAKLLLFPKKLWILDEPFTALDAALQQLFLSQITAHLANGGIAVMSSHQSLALPELQTLELSPC